MTLPRIFISHSSPDFDAAQALADALRTRGYSPWLYEVDEEVGRSWMIQVGEAIQSSKAIVVIVSEVSARSLLIASEIVAGLERSIPIVGVFLAPRAALEEAIEANWRFESSLGGPFAVTIDAADTSTEVWCGSVCQALSRLGIRGVGRLFRLLRWPGRMSHHS